jgi:hypothetical protein
MIVAEFQVSPAIFEINITRFKVRWFRVVWGKAGCHFTSSHKH